MKEQICLLKKKSFVSRRRKLNVGYDSRKNGLGGSFFYPFFLKGVVGEGLVWGKKFIIT
jgi:hypothetical protein